MRLIDAVAYGKELKEEMDYPGRSEEFMIAIDVAIADLADAPTVIAYTKDQLIDTFKKAHGLEARNEELEKECARLKNCLNCKNRKECARHCGKVVHDCDHWEYGDPVAHGRWDKYTDEKCIGCDADGRLKYRKVSAFYCDKCGHGSAVKTNYCPNCGAKMDATT